MDSVIFLFLVQDGLVNGAIYALLGIALVLVFAVTRIIFIPQGEFVAYGGLTFALLSTGAMPGIPPAHGWLPACGWIGTPLPTNASLSLFGNPKRGLITTLTACG